MATSKRDPKIGKAWLGWYALEGDEDAAFIHEYVAHAKDVVGDIAHDLAQHLTKEQSEELVGLQLFLLGLDAAMAPRGSSELKIELRRRRAGKPINRFERARKGHQAAAIVERAVAAGAKQEAALADATAATGLSRSEIFTWLKARRSRKSGQKGE